MVLLTGIVKTGKLNVWELVALRIGHKKHDIKKSMNSGMEPHHKISDLEVVIKI